MSKIDLIFATDYYSEGYQLGINIILNKELSNARNCQLSKKIKYIFQNFQYGMDVAKIANVLKKVLISEEIKEEEIFDTRISIVDKRKDLKTAPTNHVKRGLLPYDINEYDYANDREVCVFRCINGNPAYYWHSDVNKNFTYTRNNSGVQFNYNNLPNTSRKRISELNRFFKENLDMLKRLENLDNEDIGKELSINHSIIITAYRMFYNEEPSFKDPNFVTKMQCMVALLHVNVLPLLPAVSKTNYNDSNITTPESEYIRDKLLELYLINSEDVFAYIDDYPFALQITENIKFLGKTINDYLKTKTINEMYRIRFLKEFILNCLKIRSNTDIRESEIVDSEFKELRLLLTKKDSKN